MTKKQTHISQLLPLREPTFFILLSLASQEKHGYAILQDIKEISEGKVKLSTGTLYEALARLLDQGLIERVSDNTEITKTQKDQSHPGKPRKAYRLTKNGRWVLEAETKRMQSLIAAAQQRLGEKRA
jgi:DNA-binding PadR family transcriptional regulator